MRNPYFVPAVPRQKGEKEEKSLQEILRESDERVRKFFEDQDSSRKAAHTIRPLKQRSA